MEISKLTICRQDVIIVSDTETESNTLNSNKKKKHKRKTTCVRNVKLTTTTVNRIVPFCYRQRCRSAQHYHRQTSTNTKYQKRNPSPAEMKCKKSEASTKSILCETDKNDDDVNMVLTRNSYSPITVTSSSDMYENISSCSFNICSSESDELEDLINTTRKRMKSANDKFDSYPVRKSECATTTQDDYQNISSNDEVLNSSIHSMDTVVLYQGDKISRPRSPEYRNQVHLKECTNNNTEPIFTNPDSKTSHKQKVSSLSSEDNNNLSPLYEISGKVFMEHYLNTNLI